MNKKTFHIIPTFILVCCILFLSSIPAFCQSYKWVAPIEDSLLRDGFYNIVLMPEVGAVLQDDYADIRLLNGKNEEVPYILKREDPFFSDVRFMEYPIISNKIIDTCCTQLVVGNTSKKEINNMCFVLKNSDAVKISHIAGSEDGVNWFAVKQFDVFYNSYSETDTKVLTYVNFPLTDYAFYRFDITDRGYWDEKNWEHWNSDNRWALPVNVLKVGYYETFLKEGKYVSVPAPTFIQKDSLADKKTYIRVRFNDAYTINRMRLNFSGPRYFKRNVTIATKQVGKSGRKPQPDRYIPITTLEVNSYSLNEFSFDFFREKEFYLIVENNDNHALTLNRMDTWQLTHYLKTYLEKGQKYYLSYGDSLSKTPVYDLNYFVDSIPKVLPTLRVLQSKRTEIAKTTHIEKVDNWYEDKLVVWIAIISFILLLSFMSWKMLGEMKKQ
ncbi:hypothetical protein [uncultured Cytophaga sp.]|uniref:hypothetical protein n=1 Tax=uncultured Cytophaga sp. TaxID=160238 RepID=UPI0026143C38|nr:hypothetical protein [uncultured Cytophaga sp.]